jgi:hypothetical protein
MGESSGVCRYITPPGTGFLPRETAIHHQQHIVDLVLDALKEATLEPKDISAIAFTKVCYLRQTHGLPMPQLDAVHIPLGQAQCKLDARGTISFNILEQTPFLIPRVHAESREAPGVAVAATATVARAAQLHGSRVHPINHRLVRTVVGHASQQRSDSCPEMCSPGVQGPGMGGPLLACAVCARMLSLMWKVPIIGVNHCIGAP